MAYESRIIEGLEAPITDLQTIPTEGVEDMKAAFDAGPLQIIAAFNALVLDLGADKAAYDAWKAQLEALNLDAGAAASLSAAMVIVQNGLSTANTNIADRELKMLPFTDKSVDTTGWANYTAVGTEETDLFNDGFTYRKSLALTGVLANMRIVDCAMSRSTKKCGTLIWNNALPYDGGIKIYAKGTPTSAFKILTITFGR